MHCGLCLPQCPTYALTGLEKSSPRGRIRLIKSVAEGDLPITPGFVEEMNFCLDCQACETACPAGVRYGALVEAARAQIFQQGYESVVSTVLKKLFLRWLFRTPQRLQVLASLLRIYQQSGFQWFLQRSGLLKLFSRRLHEVQSLTPTISETPSSQLYPERVEPYGSMRYRVGFLTGCIMDVAFADVNVDTIELLRHHGCEVVIPRGQVCCGSLQAHNGDREVARELARVNIEVFSREPFDAIIMNSVGCGAFMKEYGHLFSQEPHLAMKAMRVSKKIQDVTEFLTTIGLQVREGGSTNRYADKRVTYHDACHLVHTQKISLQPRELIKMIPGVEYVELPESTWCCGSAGIYNITRYDDSMKLLSRKMENIKRVRPDIIVTGNPGCLVQIQHGLEREGLSVELLHTATFLRRACGA
ncbi:MAG TPA: (Fe-S)-binding protein [Bacteroidota bacterium]|nr:(Fe-S)-binding protein [Bacteroidota bacterium]